MHTKVKLSKKEQELQNYNKWLQSLEKMAPKFARQQHTQPKGRDLLQYKLSTPPGRTVATGKSLVTEGGSTAPVADKRYTGTAMLGVGTMHKSNMVPIFQEDAAKDIASMRR